jgi:glycosyltransferase involved in cell wall biosynthesis
MTIFELRAQIRFRLKRRVVHLMPLEKSKGAVLVSYFTYPFLTDKHLTGHTNYWEARQLAQEFLDRGYEVDVIDTTNTSFLPKKPYRVCIDTHNNLERLALLLPKNCIKVLHTTTTHWLVQNAAAYKRHIYLLERRKTALAPERLLPPSGALEVADIVLALGNKVTQGSYAYAGKKLFPISISAVHSFASPENKDFDRAKKNFVWLGGAGAVHKGADLVLEAFAASPALSVSMCGKYLYPEFEAVYRKELTETSNIRSVGVVDLAGATFEAIRSSSAFLIFPSCAEGQAGSVVAAMHAGLIPIVTKEVGVDVEGFGFVLENASVETIKKMIGYVSELPAEELKRRAKAAWEYAKEHHSREKFKERYGQFVDLLESKGS